MAAQQAVVPFFDQAVPAHITAFIEQNANIAPKLSVPQLSVRGKVFRIVLDGEETVLTKADPDNPGEKIPVSVVKVIVLDQNTKRSRAFYQEGYNPDKLQAPQCWSSDSVHPDTSVPADTKQCDTCAACPKAVKGSKISENGKATTACAMNKRLAVVPVQDPTYKALLLKLAVTSIWDKENQQEAKGWFAWDQYVDFLRQRGVKHTAAVVTKIKFDTAAEYPKLLFNTERYLSAEELAVVVERQGKPDVVDLLNAPEMVVAARATPVDDDDAPLPVPAKAPTKATKAVAPPPPAEDEDVVIPQASTAAAFDDEDGAAVQAPKPAAAKAPATKAAASKPAAAKAPAKEPSAAVPPGRGLDDLLKNWGA